MAHRYETIPLMQGDGNDSTDSDIETKIDVNHLELFPPTPPTPRGMIVDNDNEMPILSDSSVWSSAVKRKTREKLQGPTVVSTVDDHGTSNQEEQPPTTTKPPEQTS